MSKSNKRQATRLLNFRLTPEDYEVLVLASAVSGMGPSTFARRAAFRAASLVVPDYERKADPIAADKARILGELGRIGSNANQLARIANTTRSAPAAQAVAALVEELRALRASVVGRRESEAS